MIISKSNKPKLKQNIFTFLYKDVRILNVLFKTEPRNSFFKMADNTPLACFFISEPQINRLDLSSIFSMVALNGKGSPFAVFHFRRFSSPLSVTAQSLESLAVTSSNLKIKMELSA